MDQTGTVRFPGNLDPAAQEFRPRNPPPPPPPPITILPPHIYYPYPSPYPPTADAYQLTSPSTAYVRPPPPPPPPPLPLQPPVAPLEALSSPTSAPTRTLLLSSVPVDATQETIERELLEFGEVRGIQMERLQQDGVVTVHYYDLRHAEAALMEIREQHMLRQSRLREQYHNTTTNNSFFLMMRPFVPVTIVPACHGRGLIAGRTIWAQFMFPVGVPLTDAHNQGTIVVFNLDARVSACQLKNIFEAFGAVKEVRETPMKRHQRFVEYFDIRDADRAIKEMNGKEINGKKLLIEFSRPGGHRRFPTNHTGYSQPPSPSLQPPSSRNILRSVSDVSSSSNSSKKSNFNSWKNSRRSIADVEALGDSIASLSVNGSGSDKSSNSGSSSMKILKRKNNRGGALASKDQQGNQQQQQQSTRNRSSKGGRHKMLDSQFLIQEDAIVSESSCKRDPRTTVMIKNIPNKYSQKLLLDMLDKHCIYCNDKLSDGGDDQPLSSYDFVYLPIDFNNKCNVGYGFVNMTSPEATWRLYKAFHKQHWEVFNSKKICEISYARLQGLEALKEHFKNSKFACETDEYLPVVFAPPRDGKQQLTEPMAIGGHTKVTTSIIINKNQPVVITSKDEEEQVVDYDDNDEWLHDGDGNNHDEDTGDDEEEATSSSISSSTITSAEGTQ